MPIALVTSLQPVRHVIENNFPLDIKLVNPAVMSMKMSMDQPTGEQCSFPDTPHHLGASMSRMLLTVSQIPYPAAQSSQSLVVGNNPVRRYRWAIIEVQS